MIKWFWWRRWLWAACTPPCLTRFEALGCGFSTKLRPVYVCRPLVGLGDFCSLQGLMYTTIYTILYVYILYTLLFIYTTIHVYNIYTIYICIYYIDYMVACHCAQTRSTNSSLLSFAGMGSENIAVHTRSLGSTHKEPWATRFLPLEPIHTTRSTRIRVTRMRVTRKHTHWFQNCVVCYKSCAKA